jgi:hypothetical protein
MLRRGYLRKVPGLGGIFFMTAPAKIGDIRQLRDVSRGVFGMLCQRTVAGLTSDMGVFARGANLGLVVMAHYTGVLPGIGDRVLANQIERPGAVVAVLAKGFGHHRVAYDEK